MSTELVAIEKIEIRHGDKNADEIRMELVKYLHQFLDKIKDFLKKFLPSAAKLI